MQAFISRKVFVGQKICKHKNQLLGYGLYLHNENIHSSTIGILKHTHPNSYYIQNKFPIKCVGLQINDTVYCEVMKIREDQAFVNIIQVNSHSLNKPIEACIRKQHVRETLVDQVIMSESFRHGDYVKAKIISLGDSLRNLYLTTARQQLGVLVAKNEKTENLMLPFDWQSMVDPASNEFEKRKVAKPEL